VVRDEINRRMNSWLRLL